MEEENVKKEEKAEVKDKKGKHTEKKKHNGLRVIGIVLFILVAIFIGNTIRKYYVFNTYMLATNEYETKDNFKKVQTRYRNNVPDVVVTGYQKEDKTLIKTAIENKTALVRYYDKKTKEEITKYEARQEKVATVEKEKQPTQELQVVGFYGEMSAWSNLLQALRSTIISENYKGKECYKITRDGELELWIEKATGLVIKMSSGYVKHSDGSIESLYYEMDYEFGTVTDEDVAKPDLKGYKIQTE